MHVLIVEDNLELADNIGTFLEKRNHVVDFANDGETGLHMAVNGEHDVIVLDIGLPLMDGLEVCEKLRLQTRKRTPVLMLTARDLTDDKLRGFSAGTDDYLVKPFALIEFNARLNALARRFQSWQRDGRCKIADLEVDLNAFTVSRNGQTIQLKPAPMRILSLLCRASPWLVSRAAIEREIWGNEPPNEGLLRAHIYAIRNAIDKPYPVKLLHTVHGVGYRLVAPS
jgi:DNA-binding response OmpR family regulator